MRSCRLPFILLGFVALWHAASPAAAAARQQPGLQGPQDPGYADLIATCANPPQARGGRGGPAQAARGGAARAVEQPSEGEYAVTGIPGVIAGGERWTRVWEGTGNNADGIIGTDDGGLLMAQNDNSRVVKLDVDGGTSTVYTDTRTGGALSMSSTGALFVAERGLMAAIRQLAPERRLLANRYQGDPLDCMGGVLNDLTADSMGGVYFTMGGLFYADSGGAVTRYGEGLNTNGVILSPDERTLYVTNRGSLPAFDVGADGSLGGQREFAALPDADSGDGLAVDAAGRVYVTGQSGVHVISPAGEYLGLIPTPRAVITAAFSGADRKTLYAVSNDRVVATVYAIPMLAEGVRGRAK